MRFAAANPPVVEGWAPTAERAESHPVARLGLAVAAAAVVFQSVVHTLNAATLDLARLDANLEHTVFSWMHASAWFAIALACLLLVVPRAAATGKLLALALVFSFFSLDESIAVHEDVGVRGAELLGLDRPWDRIVWPALYLPLVAALLLLVRIVLRRAPRLTSRLVVAGLACLVLAVLAEMSSAVLASNTWTLVEQVEVVVEEGLELGGLCLIATGFLTWFALAAEASAPVGSQSIVK